MSKRQETKNRYCQWDNHKVNGQCAPHSEQEYCDYYSIKQFGKNRYQNKKRDIGKKFKPNHSSKNKHRSGFTPHSKIEGEICDVVKSFSESISSLSSNYLSCDPDVLIREVEGIVALYLTLEGCTSYTSMASALFLYVRDHCDKSCFVQIMEYVDDLLTEGEKTSLSSSFVPHKGTEGSRDTSKWIVLMRDIRDNWKAWKEESIFKHFSNIFGLLVVMNICSLEKLTFTVKDYKLFQPNMNIVHGNAADICDAAFSTITFFVEGMYSVFKERSLKPLVLGVSSPERMASDYADILSWWELVRNGNLESVQERDEHEFGVKLDGMVERLRLLMQAPRSFEKKIIQEHLVRLVQIQNDWINHKIASGIRPAPFALEFFGSSNQGKTTCGDQIVDALLASADLPLEKKYRASYNPADQYMSTWTTNKKVLVIDDMANEKSNFVQTPPTRVIIDVCNNQPYYANMADLQSKGKVFVQPSIVVVNTNVKSLNAFQYSNVPYSVQRRMHYIITVKAKDEFQMRVDGVKCGLDPAKVLEHKLKHPTTKPFDDVWLLTVEQAQKPIQENLEGDYVPVVYGGKKLVDVSINEVIPFLIEKFANHRISQNSIVDAMSDRSKAKLRKCGVDGCVHLHGYCPTHVSSDSTTVQNDDKPTVPPSFWSRFCPHSHAESHGFVDTCANARDIVKSRLEDDWSMFSNTSTALATGAILCAARAFYSKWDWLWIVPTPWIEELWFQRILMLYESDIVRGKWRRHILKCALLLYLFLIYFEFGCGDYAILWWFLGVIWVFFQVKFGVHVARQMYVKELRKRNDALGVTLKSWRDSYMGAAVRTGALLAILYTVAKLARAYYKTSHSIQGNLEPRNSADIAERDGEDNMWSRVAVRPLELSNKSRCSPPDHIRNLITKNLVYASLLSKSGRRMMANCLFMTSNILILPGHYFHDCGEEIDVVFYKANPDANGGKFRATLSLSTSHWIEGTDLVVCYCPTGGSYKNLSAYLPPLNHRASEFEMLYRDKSGSILTFHGITRPGRTGHNLSNFEGGTYANIDKPVYAGLCGATIFSKGGGSTIIGFHLGGEENSKRGCYGVLTRESYDKALSIVESRRSVCVTGEAQSFRPHSYGVNFFEPCDNPHYKSPLRYLPEDSQIEYHGKCLGMVSSQSNVRVTPISEFVMDEFGIPNTWGPPKMKPEWFAWQKTLESMSNPGTCVSPTLLERAVGDYLEPLLVLVRDPYWSKMRPLTDHENLNGIPGVKFIDAINLGTSIGYPLTGPKRNFVVENPPTLESPLNREFEPVILNEIRECEEMLRRGCRINAVAKACKKDEVLPLDKDKCRVFYGGPITLTFLIRKYYLPLTRFLQMNPLKAECAVGINCQGPEWEQFYNFVLEHGEDRILGGDYSKYDQKLPTQLILAAFGILIELAKECEYSAQDIRCMEALAGDVAFSFVAFNGDLISLVQGGHISGNPLTVIINSLVGSLNQRCAFFDKFPHDTTNFRDVVNLMTYGDDNIGSVHPDWDYNINVVASFLLSHGQTYTMPDKESTITDFLPLDDFEFLKRHNSYIEEIECNVGALSENSILKMLHCFVRDKSSPLTEEMACAQNVDTALQEYFLHGREIYEDRRAKLMSVSERAQITHLCLGLDLSFEDRVLTWKEKYDGSTSKPLKC